MRLSAIEGEDGYRELRMMHLDGYWPRVSVDGRRVSMPFFVDEMARVVQHYVRGPDGRLAFDSRGDLMTETVTGNVSIERVPYSRAAV